MPAFDDFVDELEWSEKTYTFKQFMKEFTFPQIVKVIDGFYSEDEEQTIGNDEILTVHATKVIKEVAISSTRHGQLKIATNLPVLGAVLTPGMDLISGGRELKEKLKHVNYIRVQEGEFNRLFPQLSIPQGTVLKPYNVMYCSETGEEIFDTEDINGKPVRFPVTTNATFAPLREKDDKIPLAAIAEKYTLPCTMLITSTSQPDEIDRGALCPGERILIKEKLEREVALTTVKHQSLRSMVTFNLNIPVTVTVAKAALDNEPIYVRVIDVIRDGVDLVKLSQGRGSVNFDLLLRRGKKAEKATGPPPKIDRSRKPKSTRNVESTTSVDNEEKEVIREEKLSSSKDNEGDGYEEKPDVISEMVAGVDKLGPSSNQSDDGEENDYELYDPAISTDDVFDDGNEYVEIEEDKESDSDDGAYVDMDDPENNPWLSTSYTDTDLSTSCTETDPSENRKSFSFKGIAHSIDDKLGKTGQFFQKIKQKSTAALAEKKQAKTPLKRPMSSTFVRKDENENVQVVQPSIVQQPLPQPDETTQKHRVGKRLSEPQPYDNAPPKPPRKSSAPVPLPRTSITSRPTSLSTGTSHNNTNTQKSPTAPPRSPTSKCQVSPSENVPTSNPTLLGGATAKVSPTVPLRSPTSKINQFPPSQSGNVPANSPTLQEHATTQKFPTAPPRSTRKLSGPTSPSEGSPKVEEGANPWLHHPAPGMIAENTGNIIQGTGQTSQPVASGTAEGTENHSASSKKEWPSDLSNLSVHEVGDLLKWLNFGEHVELFSKYKIDGNMLVGLTDDDLISMGLPLFQRTILKRFINGWRPVE